MKYLAAKHDGNILIELTPIEWKALGQMIDAYGESDPIKNYGREEFDGPITNWIEAMMFWTKTVEHVWELRELINTLGDKVALGKRK